jgi:hypothetical protein
MVRSRSESSKTYGLYPKKKKEEGILILVRLYVVSYQTLRLWQYYIYVVALCCNHQYSEEQRIVSLSYVYLFVYFYLLC